MKLSKLINEIASSRGGTVTDSFYSIANIADEIDGQNIGKDTYPIYVQRLGASEDGKTTEEISVRYGDGHRDYFTIYDYKFGLDPTDEDNYDNEYPFSLGVPTGNTDALEWAKKLGFNAEPMVRETEENMKEQDINDPTYIPPGIGKQAITLDDAQHDQLMNKGSVLIKVDGKTYPLVWTGFDKTDEAGDYDTMEEETLDESVDGGVEFFKRIAFKK
jgi:hypothetical protein